MSTNPTELLAQLQELMIRRAEIARELERIRAEENQIFARLSVYVSLQSSPPTGKRPASGA